MFPVAIGYMARKTAFSGNLLKDLEAETFINLPILEVLDISHNNLIDIAKGAFDSIPRLKRLYLHHNRLSSYKGDFFANMSKVLMSKDMIESK